MNTILDFAGTARDAVITFLNAAGVAFWQYAPAMLMQTAILVVFLLILNFFLKRRVRAVFRYWVWLLVLIKLMLPPTVSSPTGIGYWFAWNWRGEVMSPQATPVIPPVSIAAVESAPRTPNILTDDAPVGESDMPLAESSWPLADRTSSISENDITSLTWQSSLALLWLLGVAALSAFVIKRVALANRLVECATPPDEKLLAVFDECRHMVNIRSPVGLGMTNALSSPAVCGILHPFVLLPPAIVSKLNATQLRAVLIHELTHVVRGDLAVQAVQTVLQILHFYNPFVWLANAIIRRTREQAVDEAVLVRLGREPSDYSATLLEVAALALRPPTMGLGLIGVVESKSALAGRIRHILSRPVPRSAKLGLTGAVAVLILAVTTLPMACTNPKKPSAATETKAVAQITPQPATQPNQDHGDAKKHAEEKKPEVDARQERKQALLDLAKDYALKEGEDLRCVTPPYPDARNRFFLSYVPWAANTGKYGSIQFRWSDGQLNAGTTSTGSLDLRDMMHVAGLKPEEIQIDPLFVDKRMEMDIIIRAGLPLERALTLLEHALRTQFNIPVSLRRGEAERKFIVLRGTYQFKPLDPRRKLIEIYDDRPMLGNHQRNQKGGWNKFLNNFGDFLGHKIIDKTQNPPESAEWHFSESMPQMGPDGTRRDGRSPDPALKHFSEQTGLTYTEETRKIPVLFIERTSEPAAAEVKAVAQITPQPATQPARSKIKVGLMLSHFTATGPTRVGHKYGYADQARILMQLRDPELEVTAVIEPDTEHLGELPDLLGNRYFGDRKPINAANVDELSKLDVLVVSRGTNMKDEVLTAMHTAVSRGMGLLTRQNLGSVTPDYTSDVVDLSGMSKAQYAWNPEEVECEIVGDHPLLGKLSGHI